MASMYGLSTATSPLQLPARVWLCRAKKITFTKKTAHPERLAACYEASRESLLQTDNLVEDIIKKMIPVAIGKCIDTVLFSTTKATGAVDFVGPFVGLKAISKTDWPEFGL